MIRKLFFLVSFFLLYAVEADAWKSFDKVAVKSVMKRVADWQIANPNKGGNMTTWTGRMPLCIWVWWTGLN